MQIDFALQNILSSPRKTALAISGIGVAVLLVFMQLGFRGAVVDTATNIYQKLDFDVLVRSPEYLHFIDSGTIDASRIETLAGAEEVESVNRMRVAIANWRNPSGQKKGVLLLGVNPQNPPFRKDSRLGANFALLGSDELLLIDTKSHPEFGPMDGSRFSNQDIDEVFEVAGNPMRIAGLFELGAGLAANGAAIVDENTIPKLVPTVFPNQFTFGLIRLKEGVDPSEFVASARQKMKTSDGGAYVEILSRDEAIQLETTRWISETPIGFIFSLGVFIAVIVGAAIVYMVLSTDVSNRLNEYATLRAMGYTNNYLAFVVMKQAIYMAIVSFVPALVLSFILYWVTGRIASISMSMTSMRVVVVLSLTLGMGCLSGVLALRKLWQAAPADLF